MINSNLDKLKLYKNFYIPKYKVLFSSEKSNNSCLVIPVINEGNRIHELLEKIASLELNKLVEYLGGKDNILSTETSLSRFKVTLKDVSLVNKEAIQKLGAKGIVEIDNQLKIILGSESKQLKKYIDNLK